MISEQFLRALPMALVTIYPHIYHGRFWLPASCQYPGQRVTGSMQNEQLHTVLQDSCQQYTDKSKALTSITGNTWAMIVQSWQAHFKQFNDKLATFSAKFTGMLAADFRQFIKCYYLKISRHITKNKLPQFAFNQFCKYLILIRYNFQSL